MRIEHQRSLHDRGEDLIIRFYLGFAKAITAVPGSTGTERKILLEKARELMAVFYLFLRPLVRYPNDKRIEDLDAFLINDKVKEFSLTELKRKMQVLLDVAADCGVLIDFSANVLDYESAYRDEQ